MHLILLVLQGFGDKAYRTAASAASGKPPPAATPKTIDFPAAQAYHPSLRFSRFLPLSSYFLAAEMVMTDLKPKIIVEYQGDITIVTFTNDTILDERDVKAIEDSVLPLVRQSDPAQIILDFTNVKFLSSAVLGTLIRVLKAVNRKDGKLALCGINDKIYDIFKITRLNKIFDIYTDFAQALKSFSA
jgi:anti-sigma B factor antagonist